MKKLLLASLLLLTACTLPSFARPAPAPTESPTAEPSPGAIVPLQPTAEPGTEGNPLILAVAPTAHPSDDLIKAANDLAGRLQSLTGYKIVTAAPVSESALLQAFSLGNAHIAVLALLAAASSQMPGFVRPRKQN